MLPHWEPNESPHFPCSGPPILLNGPATPEVNSHNRHRQSHSAESTTVLAEFWLAQREVTHCDQHSTTLERGHWSWSNCSAWFWRRSHSPSCWCFDWAASAPKPRNCRPMGKAQRSTNRRCLDWAHRTAYLLRGTFGRLVRGRFCQVGLFSSSVSIGKAQI